jgi:hypothetical protein
MIIEEDVDANVWVQTENKVLICTCGGNLPGKDCSKLGALVITLKNHAGYKQISGLPFLCTLDDAKGCHGGFAKLAVLVINKKE